MIQCVCGGGRTIKIDENIVKITYYCECSTTKKHPQEMSGCCINNREIFEAMLWFTFLVLIPRISCLRTIV